MPSRPAPRLGTRSMDKDLNREFPRENRLLRTVAGLLAMTGGALAVFSLLVVMNRLVDKPDDGDSATRSEFSVEHPSKRVPPPPSRQRDSRARKHGAQARSAPMPSLAGSLSGIDVGIPVFHASNVGNLSETILGDVGNVVMTEDTVDSRPRPLSRPSLKYPERARAGGIEGYVTVSMLVGVSGDVENARVLESEPPGVFDVAALEAVRTWRFEPATYQGRPVSVWARQIIRFSLREG